MKWVFQHKWLLALAFIKFLLPFMLVGQPWELHRDEYLYYEQGQHLALGYLECPPLVAWLGYTASLMGGSFFWVKFWPSLFGAFLVLVTAGIVKEMGGKQFAQLLAALGIVCSVYLRTNFLLQPVFLEIFGWTLSAYYLLRIINTGQTKYYYLFSVAIALSWYSKYSALFFICGLLAGIVLTYHRKLLAGKDLWLAAGMALILVLPNVYWQYLHNWPLAHHMQELRETQLQYISKTDFLKEQIVMLLPVAFVWLCGLGWLLFSRQFRLIAFTYITVIVLLILGSGKGYYTLGLYPMVLAAGGVCWEKISGKRTWLRVVIVVAVLVLAYPFLFLMLPVQMPVEMAAANKAKKLAEKGILKWEDQQNHPLQQDFADMLGWKELANKAERSYDSLTVKGYRNIAVYCSSYGQGGAVNYYAKGRDFRSHVICSNGTFLLWIPQPLSFQHLLFIDNEMPSKDHPVFRHFEKATLLDSVSNPLSRQLGDKVIFFEQADSAAVPIVNQYLEKQKRIFSRPG